jgi:hypothetical protein
MFPGNGRLITNIRQSISKWSVNIGITIAFPQFRKGQLRQQGEHGNLRKVGTEISTPAFLMDSVRKRKMRKR